MRWALLLFLVSGCGWAPMDQQLSIPVGHVRLIVDTVEFSTDESHLHQEALNARVGTLEDAASLMLGDNGILVFPSTEENRDEFLERSRSTRRVHLIGSEGESSIKILDSIGSSGVRRVPLCRDGRKIRMLHAWVLRTGYDVRVAQIGSGLATLEIVPYVACRDREEIRYERLEELTCDLVVEAHRPLVLCSSRPSVENLGTLFYSHVAQGRRCWVIQFITLEMNR